MQRLALKHKLAGSLRVARQHLQAARKSNETFAIFKNAALFVCSSRQRLQTGNSPRHNAEGKGMRSQTELPS